jgi:hypothetical protein
VISLDNKTFYLENNSSGGTSNSDTIFHYQQKDDLVTASFGGGSVRFGNLIALHKGDHLEMIYQLLTTSKELKSGKAIAHISLGENNKIQLNMNWEWLQGYNNTGISTYREL